MTNQTSDLNSHAGAWLNHYPPSVKWDAPIPVAPVYQMLYDTAAHYGSRPAFDFMDKKWTWSDVARDVDHFAKGLQEQGIGKGSKVGLFLPNCYCYLVSYYAVLRAGATVVNYNPLYVNKELQHQIEDSETDYMITLDLKILFDKAQDMLNTTRLKNIILFRFTEMLPFPKNMLFKIVKGKELAEIPNPDEYLWASKIMKNDGKPAAVTINPQEDIAVLQYTGGTTGVPKGAMLTHANVTANTEQAALWLNSGKYGTEKMLGVIPFFHVFAMTAVMNFSVRCAFEIIATPRFDLEMTLKIINKKRPHYLPAVPAIYNAINNHPKLQNYDLSSLRYCISGGAPLPVEVKKAFEKNTGCTVVEGYGLTESSPIVCVNPLEGANKPASIGMPVPGTIVEIINPDDKVTPVKPGEKGELCVRGPQVMKGYWKKPKETQDVLRDGRLYTGDIAMMDEQGYVFIVDRIKDMIITNGYNVYPRNVEEAIYLYDGVEECIVAGVLDDARGEIVKAWVKPKAGYTIKPEELKLFLKDQLSPMELPRQIEIRDKPLPKTMIGKLSRKDMIAEDKANKAA